METSLLSDADPQLSRQRFQASGNGHHVFRKSWGSEFVGDGEVLFRLWAPDETNLTLRLNGTDRPMTRAADGWFELHATGVSPDWQYSFALANGMTVPDPAARAQAGDQHGPSVITDPTAYRWVNREWLGRPWDEAVLYELHVGTFTPAGTFAAAAERLPELARLGITAIELMPVAHFPGDRNWGYDGVFLYAPHNAYGTPASMKAFVDAAHHYGMMVFLDVVYNHFGPDGNYLPHYAPDFFRTDKNTPWGAAIDFRKGPVRQYFQENALYWLGEFNLDGLRFDAIDSIDDEVSETHFLIELAQRVRARFPGRHIHLVTEDARNVTHLHARDEAGHVVHFDAEWNDDFHHVAHVIATGEDKGYYRDYTEEPWRKLARALAEGYVYQGEVPPTRDGPLGETSAHLPPYSFVNFIQNHDQIGNRAFGDRLLSLAEPQMVRLLMTMLLLSPQIPLIYMGDEYGETAPFFFFSDLDGALGESVRKGRHDEAERFGGFRDGQTADDIPDPLGRETFEDSRIDWRKRDTAEGRAWLEMVRELLALRRRHVVPLLKGATGNVGQVLAAQDGVVAVDWTFAGHRLELRANFSAQPQPVPAVRGTVFRALPATADNDLAADGELPAYSIVFALD